MATRKELQEKRNKAVVAQRQAKLKSGIGSKEHKAAIKETKRLGAAMEKAAKGPSKDTSKADHVITIKNVGEYVDSKGKLKKKVSAPPAGSPAADGPKAKALPGPGASSSFARTRGGYDPDTMIDYTNTNPSYWSSVKSYFDSHSSNTHGEKGIWIPNLEKEGAGAVGLAAQAGGVRAYSGSNYARHLPGETIGGERPMTIESIFRGGTDATTGYGGEKLGRLGKISPKYHGVTMLGGEVTKVPGSEYVRRGGDFGGLLGMGADIDVGLMDRLLGGRDGDGMRLRGTMPSPIGAAATDAAAAGMLGGGGGMAGGMGGGMAAYPGMLPGIHTGYDSPAAASAFKGYGDAIGFNVGPKGGLVYRPWTMDYWKEAGIDPALWGGGMGGGMSPAYTPGMSPAYAPAYAPARGAPGGLAADLIRGTPGGVVVGTAAGTRDGLTAGRHSTHLGAYETRPGVWVWGDRPGGVSDDPEAAAARGPGWGEPRGTTIPGHMVSSVFGPRGLMDTVMGGARAGFERGSADRAEAAGGFGVADGHSADGDIAGMGEFE